MVTGTDIEWEEYQTIQGKIDKIGDFGFHVKAWAAALFTATVSNGFSEEVSWWTPLIAIAPLALFWLLDEQQQLHQSALGRRARQLERLIQARTESGTSAPRIASAISVEYDRPANKLMAHFRGHVLALFYGTMIIIAIGVAIVRCCEHSASSSRETIRFVHAQPIKGVQHESR